MKSKISVQFTEIGKSYVQHLSSIPGGFT